MHDSPLVFHDYRGRIVLPFRESCVRNSVFLIDFEGRRTKTCEAAAPSVRSTSDLSSRLLHLGRRCCKILLVQAPTVDFLVRRAHGAEDGSDAEILCLAFVAADVSLLTSAGNDRVVRCWSVREHACVLLSVLEVGKQPRMRNATGNMSVVLATF